MAATLARIKSRMMLPIGEGTEEEQAAEEPGDPRAELVRRLLEYQKYRDAADQLGALDQLQRDVFARQAERLAGTEERPLAEVGIGALLDAFAAVLQRVKPDLAREVTVERISVANRIQELVAVLETRHRMRFEQLFERISTKLDVVVTFLALLEMTKLRMTRLLQAAPDTPLLVEFVGRVQTDAELTSDRAAVATDPEPRASDSDPEPRASASGPSAGAEDEAGSGSGAGTDNTEEEEE